MDGMTEARRFALVLRRTAGGHRRESRQRGSAGCAKVSPQWCSVRLTPRRSRVRTGGGKSTGVPRRPHPATRWNDLGLRPQPCHTRPLLCSTAAPPGRRTSVRPDREHTESQPSPTTVALNPTCTAHHRARPGRRADGGHRTPRRVRVIRRAPASSGRASRAGGRQRRPVPADAVPAGRALAA